MTPKEQIKQGMEEVRISSSADGRNVRLTYKGHTRWRYGIDGTPTALDVQKMTREFVIDVLELWDRA